jgi:hypothetical protein
MKSVSFNETTFIKTIENVFQMEVLQEKLPEVIQPRLPVVVSGVAITLDRHVLERWCSSQLDDGRVPSMGLCIYNDGVSVYSSQPFTAPFRERRAKSHGKMRFRAHDKHPCRIRFDLPPVTIIGKFHVELVICLLPEPVLAVDNDHDDGDQNHWTSKEENKGGTGGSNYGDNEKKGGDSDEESDDEEEDDDDAPCFFQLTVDTQELIEEQGAPLEIFHSLSGTKINIWYSLPKAAK